jgi:hypothetical protein
LGDGTVSATPTSGTYERRQDPDSGEIYDEFVPTPANTVGPAAQYDIQCYARGYTDLGFRSSANRETYLKGDYNVFEAIEFTFPAKYKAIGRQSYITNIRMTNRPDQVLWIEEETGLPTVFQVGGVTPVIDPFGKLREWVSVLTRAEIQ